MSWTEWSSVQWPSDVLGTPTTHNNIFEVDIANMRKIHGARAENRLSRKLILEAVSEQCREYCEDGVAWAASSVGKEKLKNIANAATFRLKRVNPVYLQNQSVGLTLVEGFDAGRIRKRGERLAEIARFPDSIRATEVYRRLGLDMESRGAQGQVSRNMKSAGFVARRVKSQCLWERVRYDSQLSGIQNMSDLTTRVKDGVTVRVLGCLPSVLHETRQPAN